MNNTIRTFAMSAFVAAIMTLPAAAQMQPGAMADTPAAKESMEAHQKMEDTMKGRPSDGRCRQGLRHDDDPPPPGGRRPAEIDLKYGKDPEMKGLAEEIVAGQKEEIDEMQKWLSAHK